MSMKPLPLPKRQDALIKEAPRSFNYRVRTAIRPKTTYKLIHHIGGIYSLVRSSILAAMMEDSSQDVFRKYKYIQKATLQEHKLHIQKSGGKKLTTHIYRKKNIAINYKKKMPAKRGRRKTTKRRTVKRRYKPRGPARMIQSQFPGAMCVKMKSYHQGQFDPAASSDPANVILNINNPLDPIDTTGSANFTLNSTEHHLKDWTIYENLYDNFEVISYKVTATFYSNNQVANSYYFIVPTNEKNHAEILAICNTASLGGIRLKEAYKRAIVKFMTTSSAAVEQPTLFTKGNVRTLEGYSKNNQDIQHVLRGKTLAHADGQAAPTRTPHVILGMGAMRSGIDLTQTEVVIKVEQCILFTNLSQREGASV